MTYVLTDGLVASILEEINLIREDYLHALPITMLPPGIPEDASKCVIAEAVATDEYPYTYVNMGSIAWWRADTPGAVFTKVHMEGRGPVVTFEFETEIPPSIEISTPSILRAFIVEFDEGSCDRLRGLAHGIPIPMPHIHETTQGGV